MSNIRYIDVRGGCYILLWIVITIGITWFNIAQSKVALEAGDLSAMAWVGFLPYILPWFMVQAGCVTIVVVVIVEIAVRIRNKT